MTTLINAPTGQTLDLVHFRHALAGQLVGSIRPIQRQDARIGTIPCTQKMILKCLRLITDFHTV